MIVLNLNREARTTTTTTRTPQNNMSNEQKQRLRIPRAFHVLVPFFCRSCRDKDVKWPNLWLFGRGRSSSKGASISLYRALVAQLVEHRAVTLEAASSTPAGPTLRVFK